MSDRCELCHRRRPLTFHHLIPRTLHSNKWFKKNFTREQMAAGLNVCRDCHGAIHRFIPEKRLGREYNTRKKLLAEPQVAQFVAWIAKRDTGRVRTAASRRKRDMLPTGSRRTA